MLKDFNILLKDQPEVIEGNLVIRQALMLLIMTERGTRPFNRNYGLGLHQFIGSTISKGTAEDIAMMLRLELERAEPRIVLDKRSMSVVALNENDLGVSFSYYVKDTSSWDNIGMTLKIN
ncbi:MAG: GPW/gp25 family protein [Rickettsiales bacterium]|jgi:phage baseplate assembly protein W|nr:GPW/gp25 family protein [Rickettsiales bacterium]